VTYMSKKFYLAGPMSGIPGFNYPTFRSATTALRAAGFEIVSPVEMDEAADPEGAATAGASPDGNPANLKPGFSWGDCLARDVKVIANEVDGLVLLPGWSRSKGARLEAFVAVTCGKQFLTYPDLVPIPGPTILLRVAQTMLAVAA